MNDNYIPDSISEAIIAYFENKLSQEQADELIAWLGQDSQNKEEFLASSRIWYAAGLSGKKQYDTDKAFSLIRDKIRARENRPLRGRSITIGISRIYKIAAAILILVTLGTGTFFILSNKKDGLASGKYFIAEAPRGSRSVISLPDGSSVWLNSGTKLTYSADFGDKFREVTLEGEAFFSVAENAMIPFRVKTPDIVITALGTSFNVKAYSEEEVVEATLETGKIRIDPADQGRNATIAPVFLRPNQKAVFVRSTKNLSFNDMKADQPAKRSENIVKSAPVEVSIDTLFDTRMATSWKDSRWIFKSERLKNLVPILERRYDVTISFTDSLLSDYRFTGTLKEETLEQVMTALCIALPILKYEITDNLVVLSTSDRGKIITN